MSHQRGTAYRATYNGKPGIAWVGPFEDELTWIGDDGDHTHVPFRNADGKHGLLVGEPVYVAEEEKPAWVRESIR